MKQIIFSLLILSFLISCQQQQSKEKRKTFEEHINEELSKNIENETIFLGLQFGMGGEEVYNYFRDLEQQGKLKLVHHEYLSDKGKIYIYNFEFGDEDFTLKNVVGTFKTYYMKDKLYKLRISVESEQDSALHLLKAKLKEEYILKYGEIYITKESIFNNSKIYTWVDGNTMIEISEGLNRNILIIYTDLTALKDDSETPREALMREV